MTVYEIIKDIDEAIPHNTEQVKSKIVLSTYRFVTSANFALGMVVIEILIAMFLFVCICIFSR